MTMTTIKNSKTRRAPAFLVVAVALHLLSAPAGADMMYNQERVPVERLIARLENRLADKPDDPHVHYTLGRVHYFAATHGQAILNIVERRYSSPGAPGSVIEHWSFPGKEDARPLEKSEVREHTRRAVEHHRRALELADEALYHLGLASLLEELAENAGEVELDEPLKIPSDLKVLLPREGKNDEGARAHAVKRWQLVALDHYAKAFEKQFEHDRGHGDWRDLGLITLEAERGFRRLAEKLGAEEIRAEQLMKLAEGRREIESRPGVITPIILALRPVDSIEDLLDREASVAFDLDGTGRDQRWEWVQPETGILVWDPDGTREIRSGRQLFGSVTWWMFWEDGYQALSMLDDNGSGWLRDGELDGLAVWFDRNVNGVADPGEVTPVRELGITAIAVDATGEEGGMPKAERGVELHDGTILPTWDWIAKPGSAKAERKTPDAEGQAGADWTPQGMKINTRGVAHLPEEIRGETFLPETVAWELKADVMAEKIEDEPRSQVRGEYALTVKSVDSDAVYFDVATSFTFISQATPQEAFTLANEILGRAVQAAMGNTDVDDRP